MKLNNLCALLLLLGLLAGGSAAAGAPAGKHHFVYTQAGKHVLVWYYLPAAAGPDAPVLVVMHGVGRNGEEYLADWTAAAEQGRFLLIVPEFSKAEFPGDPGYNYGNTVTADGQPRPREQWSFGMIEPVFDAVRARTGHRTDTYRIYGHSAGAQFVQRLLYFMPNPRLTHAVAANAGWYMLPDLAAEFPYGLKGTPVTAAAVRAALAKPFTVLLGEAERAVKARSLAGIPTWRNPTEKHGKRVWYADCVGTEPRLVDVILDRVQEAANA